MKHIRLVMSVRDSGTTLENASIAYMPSRSYAVDPHGYRIIGRDSKGKSLGSLWVANPLLIRVLVHSGGSFQEHAVKVPTRKVTIFVPFLPKLTSVTVGYPGERSTRIDLSQTIRAFCDPRSTRDEDCGDWLQVHHG